MNELERLKKLEEKVAELEKQISELVPWWNQWPDEDYKWPKFPDICPQCQMKWEDVMGYCCPSTNCPMGAGPIMCGNQT